MTSKELRKQRRREEHNIRKEAVKRTGRLVPVVRDQEATGRLVPVVRDQEATGPFSPVVGDEQPKVLPQHDAAPQPDAPAPLHIPAPTDHTERNRKNAQLSTGPKTPEGKTAASKNAFRHGLASNLFLVLPWENADDFDVLLDNLRAEHRPATQTEALLVEKMAQHFWLSQRALRLQELCFHRDAPLCDQPKDLALYLRYGTTHDRAFHRCLTEFQKLRAAQQKMESGFLSQRRQQAAETRKQELHEARLRAITAKKPEAKTPVAPPTIPENVTVAPQTICKSEIPGPPVTVRAA